ncbi:hypothetical protein TrRE_jg2651 [Triparma retinervis]|uniref:Uncharacterized protein n=1 Tax=Triparma retinervis TaxID=2557542 RepID=A0A9W6ZEZ3_9STRA|nr:hypothetical protein TrRE_jg2651 [Triparma retinervis]
MDPSKTAYAGGQPQAYATASAPPGHYANNPQAAYAAQQQMYQPQYHVQGGQPVAAYPAPPPQIIVQQVMVEPPAPGLLDLRSAQEQHYDNAERNPNGKEDIDQYAWCLLSCCIWPIPICAYVWCCGGGTTGLERPCGARGCDPERCEGMC